MKHIFLVLLFFSPVFADIQPEGASGYRKFSQGVEGSAVMVASSNRHASEAALEVLNRGGSAVDAAIACQAVLNVVEPQSSGIGGGGFLLTYRAKDQTVHFYDGREVAPKNYVPKEKIPIVGGSSVGVPGLLKMLEMAHQEEGKLSWPSLFTRAIELAEEGFPISHRLHTLIKSTAQLDTFKNTQAHLFEGDLPKKEGALLFNPSLAAVFREIQSEGSAPLYKGALAKKVVEAVQKEGGFLTEEDLASYTPIKRTPLTFYYRGAKVVSSPPPAGGVVVAQILGMLEPFPVENHSRDDISFLHHFCQICRLAYADKKAYLADPDFFPVPVGALLNKHYLKKRANLVNSKAPILHVTAGKWPNLTLAPHRKITFSKDVARPSTSHISIVDSEGNMVALTSSIENAFGSTLFVEGFFLNNQLTDFSTAMPFEKNSVANRPEPGKRPLSAMAPTFVFDRTTDTPLLTVGSCGGSWISIYIAEALIGVIDFNLSIQEAINLPHVVCKNEVVELEKNTSAEELSNLFLARGYKSRVKPLTSGTQGVQIKDPKLIGGVDPRREGVALGN